ncbi:MAG: von Willebrand factor type A domain-containing protein [Verrucomicrobiota bacterium]|nr:von Willebrand factor type A domain-containing protein [Verrucomicrobiota bacterium]
MKIDDPKLTAYALGEGAPREQADIEHEIANSPEAQAYVAEIRGLAESLTVEFAAELHGCAREKHDILPLPYGTLFWSERQWPTLAMAALLIGALLVTAVLMWRTATPTNAYVGRSRHLVDLSESSNAVILDYGEANVGRESRGAESPFILVTITPHSVFSTAVGTSSFAAIRTLIESGIRPPKDAVRIEEMLNYFSYDYPPPPDDQPAVLAVDAASCPWADGHQLVRVGARFKDARHGGGTDDTADGSTIEVEFNPERVEAYRLIGYDAPAPTNLDGTNTLPARETVIGLYEIIPVADPQPARPNDVLTARLRLTGDERVVNEQKLKARAVAFNDASADFRFAAAVAAFGMLLRDSPYKGSASIADVITWANAAGNSNPQAERTAFVECARKAQALL